MNTDKVITFSTKIDFLSFIIGSFEGIKDSKKEGIHIVPKVERYGDNILRYNYSLDSDLYSFNSVLNVLKINLPTGFKKYQNNKVRYLDYNEIDGTLTFTLFSNIQDINSKSRL